MTAIEVRSARLQSLAPQFLVADLQASIGFYRDRLGFQTQFVFGDFYAAVARDGVTIHLKLSDVPDPSRSFKRINEHLDAYVQVSGIGDLAAEFERRDAPLMRPLAATEWGTREFAVCDPDGSILYFGEPQPPPAE
jgi:catechol 2,3-dioxygenase-like lactoylglutathione lyase family enzyme